MAKYNYKLIFFSAEAFLFLIRERQVCNSNYNSSNEVFILLIVIAGPGVLS